MTQEELGKVKEDTAGLKTYEFMVNHLDELTDDQLVDVIDHMATVDHSGQYLASGVRYMNGVDRAKYSSHISRMTSMIIDRDREHRYISELITSLYGADYYDHVKELAKDNNFRRMYKRLFPSKTL